MRRFEFTDGDSNKYWEIAIAEAALTVRFGKMGAGGTSKTKPFDSVAAAEAEAAKLIREKLRKGYREVSSSPAESPSQTAGNNAFELSAFELEAIADFLAAGAQNFRDQSCNDYLVPATDQNRAVLEAALRRDAEDGVLDEANLDLIRSNAGAESELFIWDFFLMGYLADRVRSAQLGLAGDGRAGVPLSESERILTANLLDVLADNDYQLYATEEGCEDFSLDVSPTLRTYFSAVIEHTRREGWQEKSREIMAAGDVISVFSVDMLRWLSQRCRHAVPLPAAVPASAGSESQDSAEVTRLGIAKTWVSDKALVKQATEQDDSWLPAYRKNDADLICYAEGGNPFREYLDHDVPTEPPYAYAVKNLLWTASSKHMRNAILALFGPDASLDAQAELAQWITYLYWQDQVEVHRLGSISPGAMVYSLACCLYKGYMPQARLHAVLLHHAIAAPDNTDKSWGQVSSLRRWLASIAFSYWELDSVPDKREAALPPHVAALNEPILIELYRHWRAPDLSQFVPHLLWLCDGSDKIATRVPIFVHAWFRLREALGLPNPSIDHPLLKPAYAQLPPPGEMYTDPTLEAVIARLQREELPLLGDLDLLAPPPRKESPPLKPAIPEEVAAVKLIQVGLKKNFNVYEMRIPADWRDVSLPEMLRFRDPATQTELCVSAYRNPGFTYIEWADKLLPAYAATHPRLMRTRERYQVVGPGWWGWAEEFAGADAGSDQPLRYLVVGFRNKLRLFCLVLKGTQEAFVRNETLYRWLIERGISLSDVDFEANARTLQLKVQRHAELWPERQDVPGLQRLATNNQFVDSSVVTDCGINWYFGQGDTAEQQQANRDKVYAGEWFERGAELGNATAQFNLAVLLSNGDGVPKNAERAAMWCRKAAEQGYAKAQNLFGQFCWDGEGVPFDMDEARVWFGKAAAQSNEAAQRALNTWTAAEQGELEAIYDLAYKYQKAERYSVAVDLYRKAAESAEVSPVNSANMFENGSAAQCNLADKYEHGLGVPQDYEQAVHWYLKSAAKNNYVAQYSLGMMYLNGRGVPKDMAQARTWLTRSAEQGYEDARSALHEIAKLN